MMKLNEIRFHRCLTPPDAVGQPILCILSDASGEAFGTCAYARWQLSSGEFETRFIVRHVHQCGHAGIAATVAKIRSRYWIIGAHDLAKSVKFRCVFCREMGVKAEFQVMADLPPSRVAPLTPPFYFTSCDYFGTYSVRIGRNKTTKHYGVIFTCLNTRAVHLDLAVDCSTMEFIQVLRRFSALRGVPSLMISDNGTQFVGAERQLREMIEGWDKGKLREYPSLS